MVWPAWLKKADLFLTGLDQKAAFEMNSVPKNKYQVNLLTIKVSQAGKSKKNDHWTWGLKTCSCVFGPILSSFHSRLDVARCNNFKKRETLQISIQLSYFSHNCDSAAKRPKSTLPHAALLFSKGAACRRRRWRRSRSLIRSLNATMSL